MEQIRFTLISDGSADKALVPLIHWLLSVLCPKMPVTGDWADLARLPSPPRDLKKQVMRGCELYPCNILFVHRDAERESREKRVEEIQCAVTEARHELGADSTIFIPDHVCVIPVRMLEAWLLFSVECIRKAAGNPNGRVDIQLPAFQRIERTPDPKGLLYQQLLNASELRGRKRNKFRPERGVHLLAHCIDDFSPLRQLPAFVAFERELQMILRNLGI